MLVSPVELHRRLLCLPPSCLSAHEIIAYDQAENEPCRSNRASECPTDLRFADARIVAHRDLDNPESAKRGLQDHLNCPAVRVLFQRELLQDICTRGAKRPQIADSLTIEYPDHEGR